MHQVSVASILFIDNPVGTGYSYVTHDSAFTTDVHQIAADLMTTITAFLQQLPDFQVEASEFLWVHSVLIGCTQCYSLICTYYSSQVIFYE